MGAAVEEKAVPVLYQSISKQEPQMRYTTIPYLMKEKLEAEKEKSHCCGAGAASSRNYWPEPDWSFGSGCGSDYISILNFDTCKWAGSSKWPKSVFVPKNHKKIRYFFLFRNFEHKQVPVPIPTSCTRRRLRLQCRNFLKVGAEARAATTSFGSASQNINKNSHEMSNATSKNY